MTSATSPDNNPARPTGPAPGSDVDVDVDVDADAGTDTGTDPVPGAPPPAGVVEPTLTTDEDAQRGDSLVQPGNS